MVQKLINGHYYIAIKPKKGNILFIDGGVTEQEAIAQLRLLNRTMNKDRHMQIKGLFCYDNNQIVKYKFVVTNGQLVSIKKVTA